jgi:hypothetical protein
MRSTAQNKASFKGVNLVSAKVTGNVEMDGATFDGDLNAGALQVGAHLVMGSNEQNKASFKAVNLGSAKVTGNVDMDGATFEGNLDAYALQVGADSDHAAHHEGSGFRRINHRRQSAGMDAVFDAPILCD